MSRPKTSRWIAAAVLAVGLSGPGAAHAHKGSDAFLEIKATRMVNPSQAADGLPDMQWRFGLSVALKDLDLIVPIDANGDAKITWGETKAALPEVLQLIRSLVTLDEPTATGMRAGQTNCALNWQFEGLKRRSDGSYLDFSSLTQCRPQQTLALNYRFLKDQDANHRLMVAGSVDGKDLLTTVSPQQTASLVLVVGPSRDQKAGHVTPKEATDLSATRGLFAVVVEYFRLGVQHLLEGYDHLAFLLALVLPLQLHIRWRPGRTPGEPQRGGAAGFASPSARGDHTAWFSLLATVTAFTVGHSITLVLSTFGWASDSPVWVEPVIAASIGVTALLNLHPVKGLRMELLAALFGLIHGYGFAGLLQESAAPDGLLPYALVGFNLGIEAGQLIAVSIWIAISQFLISRAGNYDKVVRRGSYALAVLSAGWFLQRIL